MKKTYIKPEMKENYFEIECDLLAASYGTEAPTINNVEADSKPHFSSFDVFDLNEEED